MCMCEDKTTQIISTDCNFNIISEEYNIIGRVNKI